MNFEEFKQQLMEDLKEALSRRVGTEIAVEENEVHKLQQESYDGIVIRKENESIGVNVDATRLYSDLEQGRAYEDVLHYAVDIAQKGFEDAPKIDISQIMNYEVMKHSLITQLIPVAGNEDMLANIPHKQIEDLALVYRFSVGRDEHGQSTILVKNDMLDRYGITAEQLHQDALENAPLTHPASLRSMQEVMADMMGMKPEEIATGEPMMLVAAVEGSFMGASVIQYPGFMDQAAEKIGGDFFVLPSSIHEVLLIPDDGTQDYHDLAEMVQTINETQVAPAERLSDNVYHYDKADRVFELADKTASRKLAQEMEKKAAARGGAEKKPSVLEQLGEKKKEAMDHAPKAKASGRTAPEAAL